MCTHSVQNYSLQTQGLPYNLELILLNCSSVLNNKLREIDIWSGKIFWFLYRLEIPAWAQQLKWLGMNENRTTFISVCSKNQYLCKFCKWAQKVWRELGQLIIYKQNIFLYQKKITSSVNFTLTPSISEQGIEFFLKFFIQNIT